MKFLKFKTFCPYKEIINKMEKKKKTQNAIQFL